jgi:hypothetical protein
LTPGPEPQALGVFHEEPEQVVIEFWEKMSHLFSQVGLGRAQAQARPGLSFGLGP